MPRQIQKIKQTQKIIQTHQEHTRARTKKINKPRKIIKEYCTNKINLYIYTNQIIQKKKIDLNPKIKSIQSLTKCPQN